ncbi:MAG: adenosylcobinamide-GDP ribazoletransferase, partial [Nitrospirota bacterium]
IALQFLTILPVRGNPAVDEDDIARSSSLFVIVGILQGILLIMTDYGAGRLFHPDLAAGMILLVLVLSNGGFHLDGLADTFDALAVKSESDRHADMQKRLAIMKTGATGPVGVMAIIFSLALKYLALKSLSNFLPFTYLSSLFLMPVLSKWAVVVSIFHGRPARKDGLGKIFIGRTGLKELGVSTTILISVLVLLQIFSRLYAPDNQSVFHALMLMIIYFLCRLAVRFFHRRFGGLTGDTLGAISEMTEIIFLLTVIAWSRLSIL